jgi:hypothetical protein
LTFEEFCQHFRLGAWREENNYRRECDRSIAIHVIETGAQVERLLSHWQAAVDYGSMGRNDKESFRQRKSNVRQTVNYWHLLDPDEQTQFRTGDLLPYRATKLIRSRRSAGVVRS